MEEGWDRKNRWVRVVQKEEGEESMGKEGKRKEGREESIGMEEGWVEESMGKEGCRKEGREEVINGGSDVENGR